MDGFLYPVSLLVVALLVFSFYRTHNNILALIVLFVGIYIVYTHETGSTATDWKNDIVESVDKSVGKYNSERGISKYDEKKLKEEIK
ncbi:hypothetical protein [Sulfurimonas sp.]|uniref:hypothetical protein n=1 Tax=Sulfurimonas sp. TaxID=2022749 RepID=UPI0026167D93|nr:hypothetical protein [Sulfurimonas sp.]MCW8896297.1 hypothetical protein [Sulfurimonas sp.]MCW9068396.1 hypothetical protein [Sulfurimonas sp.]